MAPKNAKGSCRFSNRGAKRRRPLRFSLDQLFLWRDALWMSVDSSSTSSSRFPGPSSVS
ncbi:hypothetical protein OAD67_02195 [bacterium]|nr:hypothetical protein [bacterium]